jgi:Fur family zinc uptake transcriptional regulator
MKTAPSNRHAKSKKTLIKQYHNCAASSRPGYLDSCFSLLTNSGLRLTAPRKAVISFLARISRPITITQLHAELANSCSDRTPLSKVSLYRVIADLERIQLLHQVHPTGGYLLCTHVGCSEHSHIIISCQRCNDTRESTVPGEYLSPLLFFLKNAGDLLPQYPILRIEGICKECQKEQ